MSDAVNKACEALIASALASYPAYQQMALSGQAALAKVLPAQRAPGGYVHPLAPGETSRSPGAVELVAFLAFRKRLAAALQAATANWATQGQPVVIIHDQRLDGRCLEGRHGRIHRLCTSSLSEYCYVFLPRQGRQRKDRVEMFHILQLAPADEATTP